MPLVVIMVSIVIMIAIIVSIPALKEALTTTMGAANLDCTNAGIPITNKITCNLLELSYFYIIAILLAVSLAWLTGKNTIPRVITSIVVFMIVIILVTPLKDFISLARSTNYLSCADTSIWVGAKMACLFVDLWLFLFIVLAISSGITYVIMKKVGQ